MVKRLNVLGSFDPGMGDIYPVVIMVSLKVVFDILVGLFWKGISVRLWLSSSGSQIEEGTQQSRTMHQSA